MALLAITRAGTSSLLLAIMFRLVTISLGQYWYLSLFFQGGCRNELAQIQLSV
jgi:hypothetical protein